MSISDVLTNPFLKGFVVEVLVNKFTHCTYRLQTNRMGETLHRTLGAMLRKACASKLDWAAQGPFAMFALRAALNRDTGLSPYELVYGNTTAELVPQS